MKSLVFATSLVVWIGSSLQALPVVLNYRLPGPNPLNLPTTQPSGQGAANVADWLDTLTPAPNDIGNTHDIGANSGAPSPAPGYPTFPGGTNPIELPTGDYEYLVLHWGGQGGGYDYAYDLRQCAPGSTFVFSNPDGNNGLSFYRFYRPSKPGPDAVSSLSLLGLGTLGIALYRRQIRKS